VTTLLLYAVTILVWGTSWYAIKLQVGDVPPEVSVAYRFALASLCVFGWAWATRVPLRLTGRAHAMVALMGVLLFCANLTLLYYASLTLTSGLVSVAFSTITVMNIINARLILGTRASLAVWASAVLGVCGLAVIFRTDLLVVVQGSGSTGTIIGLLYCMAGTYIASVGNIWAVRVQGHGVTVVQGNAWGMAYGASALCAYALLQGHSLAITPTPAYIGGLLYLAMFASVIGFSTYLTLLKRIGPERAGYCAVAFPVVALIVSAFLENFRVSVDTVLGGAIVIAGNVLALHRAKA
jgi:drug/metabolite transporter (DMT)-like permease